jgi:predicted nucleotidyltransferase component of viral defense system
MTILEQHEQFEIELLDKLKTGQLVNPLVFGGGTMLRLCYDLNRYSADLDFWIIKKISYHEYFEKLCQFLRNDYELTDAQEKYYSLLIEIRSTTYPKRLKLEIRKGDWVFDFQDKIAYSKHSTKQVLIRTHTLEQTMKNKISALLDRDEIRDAFDIEFLLRKGISLPPITGMQHTQLVQKLDNYKDNEFKVKLGSIIESELRPYYIQNRFSFLKEVLNEQRKSK